MSMVHPMVDIRTDTYTKFGETYPNLKGRAVADRGGKEVVAAAPERMLSTLATRHCLYAQGLGGCRLGDALSSTFMTHALAIGMGLVSAALTLAFMFTPAVSSATPQYAVRAARACDTCHIEPTGWLDPPEHTARRCSLDCNSCHVSRSGGGMRNPTGRFFNREQLSLFGSRPSESRSVKGTATTPSSTQRGRYRLWEGFSGWDRSGETPIDEIPDRLGDIDPTPTWMLGSDLRTMVYAPITEGKVSAFPMQADFYAALWPMEHLVVHAGLGMQGRRRRTFEQPTVGASVADLVAVGELFAEWSDLPYNAYLRGGRLRKNYGWRLDDHTTLTRSALGFRQQDVVYGVEAGINPNYPYANISAYYQRVGARPPINGQGAVGVTLNAGIRELGWHFGGSAEVLYLLDDRAPQITLGPNWAINLYPFAVLGELGIQLRGISAPSADPRPDMRISTETGIAVFHEVNLELMRGLRSFIRYEWYDANLAIRNDQEQRVTGGLDIGVYTAITLSILGRAQFFSKDRRASADSLAGIMMMHVAL